MGLRRRLLVAAAVMAAAGTSVVGTSLQRAGAATPRIVGIGVDGQPEATDNFLYTDFFPRSNTTVHQGDVLQFAWAAVPDGFHNVAVLKTGLTPAQAWGSVYPTVVPDAEDGAGSLQLNPVINVGNVAPPGAPGGCGNLVVPCSYGGTQDIISAAAPTDGQSTFFVRMDAPVGTTVNFVCLVHPGMAGSAQIVSATTTTTSDATLAARRQSQWIADTIGARNARAAADHALVSRRGDGTRLIQMQAGVTAPHVEVAQMLPSVVHIHPGDVVQWRYTAGIEIHTVTFPQGTNQGEPLVPACENGATDGPFAPPTAGPPCGDVTKFEVHALPQPQGVTGILTASSFGSSGLIAAPPAPLPSSFAFSFPDGGVFTYQCHIHDHMTGTVRVDTAT